MPRSEVNILIMNYLALLEIMRLICPTGQVGLFFTVKMMIKYTF